MSSEPTSTTADGTPPDRTRFVDTLVARAKRHTTLEEVYYRLGERGFVADTTTVTREVGVVALGRHAEWEP